jgi:hypothetical protein
MKQIATIENADYVDDPDRMWLYVIGRVKPGVDRAALQAKLSGQLRQLLAPGKNFSTVHDRPLLEKAHVVLSDGGNANIHSTDNRSFVSCMSTSFAIVTVVGFYRDFEV